MVPGRVLGPEASKKGPVIVIQRFEKIFENRILRSKNRIFMIRNKIDRKKHDFRSDSKSIGSLSITRYHAQFPPSQSPLRFQDF